MAKTAASKKVANTAASKRAKGSRAERKVAEAYRRYDIDPEAKRQLLSGGGYLKGDIYKPNDYQYVDEVKCQEKVKLWEFWNQTTEQAKMNQVPVLHITGNNRPILTVLNLEDYMNLRAEVKQLEKQIKELQEGV